jgi:hypothetical protein
MATGDIYDDYDQNQDLYSAAPGAEVTPYLTDGAHISGEQSYGGVYRGISNLQSAYKNADEQFGDVLTGSAQDADPYNPASYAGAQSGANPMAGDHAPQYAATIEALTKAKDDGISGEFLTRLKKGFDYLSSPEAMKNPLVLMGLSGIGRSQQNAYDREKAATAQQYALDQQNNRAAIDQGIVNRNSAAITALKKPGIVSGALTRLNGSQVFNPNGTIAR